jgi:hypothetical protein
VATLLHLYNPRVRADAQVATWDCLVFATWPHNLQIWHRACYEPLDMANWLQFHWDDDGDLLIWEQDILATPDHVKKLRRCPEPVCAYDYLLPHGVPWTSVPGGTGLGLWKATRDARMSVTATPPVPRVPWHDLGAELWDKVGPSHVHRPMVGHNHVAK